ncbi:MAG: UDP-N-acetylmuramoyl-L-alanyl-D-glutamate--2,6-diaminopimelate ligase [Patescibacteria group bacterium]|nr:UDP-N-acetylmuramoyl-L-alanyl-D-glutamate--2,6-diaminopimelate ligase [Patescibacteria group bacterium]
MKNFIKKFVPEFLISLYHLSLAKLAAFFYHYPSRKMVVIGVTGTNGKSTVVNLIARVLEEEGYLVGLTSSYNFKIGKKKWPNKKKMTMLGRFQLQKLLQKMYQEKCQYAVIETSSEGIKQFRHLGLDYDLVVFTNLTPEHIESHGSFENYKKAKGELFKSLSKSYKKNIKGKEIEKTSIVNLDDKASSYFLSFEADKKYVYGLENKAAKNISVIPENYVAEKEGSRFVVKGKEFNLKLLGKFNIYNALAAVAVGLSQSIALEKIKTALERVETLPGRMEFIREGQDFKVIVDYAPEPVSLRKMYEVIDLIDKKRIIHVLGSCGGGRDKSRRPVLGQIAGKKASLVIVTNEDPYDEKPESIIDQVAKGAEKSGKKEDLDLFKIVNRKKAIETALNKAQAGDLVIITGKGAEQAICVDKGQKIPWDDRKVIKEILTKKR